MAGNSEWRGGAFIGVGALLVAVGLFLGSGWPFVLAGFVLLVLGTAVR